MILFANLNNFILLGLIMNGEPLGKADSFNFGFDILTSYPSRLSSLGNMLSEDLPNQTRGNSGEGLF